MPASTGTTSDQAAEDKPEPKSKDKPKPGRVDRKDPYEGLPRRRFFTDAGANITGQTGK